MLRTRYGYEERHAYRTGSRGVDGENGRKKVGCAVPETAIADTDGRT